MASLFTPVAVTAMNSSVSFKFLKDSAPKFLGKSPSVVQLVHNFDKMPFQRNPFHLLCTHFGAADIVPEKESGEVYRYNEDIEEEEGNQAPVNEQTLPLVKRPRRRYRKKYPGEEKGITEEMRFVAMKLRNSGNIRRSSDESGGSGETAAGSDGEKGENYGEDNVDGGTGETWQPSIEGFLNYLVDSELVFNTVERIIDESSDVSYVYFRKSGLERSAYIARDLKQLREQGNNVPQPSKPGVAYAQYLVELADKSPPLFLCHLYNIYFSHIAGGQVIAKQVVKQLLEGRELAVYSWEGDPQELLRGFREKLNALSEHWTRDVKNKCLREATKAFRFLGQIARLIVL